MNIVNTIVPFENLDDKKIISCVERFKSGKMLEFSNSWEELSDLDKFYVTCILSDLFDQEDKNSFENYKWVKKNVSDFKKSLEVCYVFNCLLIGSNPNDSYNFDSIEKEVNAKMPDFKNKKHNSLFYKNIEKLHINLGLGI